MLLAALFWLTAAQAASYDYSLEPLKDLTFEWSVREDRIDIRLTRSKTLGWFGMGLSESKPYNMGYADFWLTLHTVNYTGVFDLWRPANSNGYPCWDVLCQDCGPFCGTQNLLDRETSREGTNTVSTWSRNLTSSDEKDWDILESGNHVLFAVGTEDWFYQHQKNDAIMVRVNLFNGQVFSAQDWAEKEAADHTGQQTVEQKEPPAEQKKVEGTSPVFIRKDADGDHIIRPTGQCMPCLKQSGGEAAPPCRSAVVECSPGQEATETLYSQEKCQGEIISVKKVEGGSPTARLQCPDLEFSSVDNLDLERFVPKLLREASDKFGKSEELVRAAMDEYKRMLKLAQTHPELSLVPSLLVDQVWHAHILDTQAYARDCQRILGRFLHHAPSFDSEEGSEEQQALKAAQEEMFLHYQAQFGAPNKKLWPTAAEHGDIPTLGYNSCCSGSCVKPACNACVGCNAVYCGTFWSTELAYPPL